MCKWLVHLHASALFDHALPLSLLFSFFAIYHPKHARYMEAIFLRFMAPPLAVDLVIKAWPAKLFG